MSNLLIAGVGLVYIAISIGLIFEGKPWLSITFLGYALGNLGLYMVARGGT